MRKLIASLALAFVCSALIAPSPSTAAVHHGRSAPTHVVSPHWIKVLRAGYRSTRTVEESEVVGGHLLHFMALSSTANASLPKFIDIASVDGGPDEAISFTPPIPPDTSMMLADANQNTGNFPGVVALTAGSSNIVVTNGSSSNPTIDLATGISLSAGTPLSLTGTTTNTIQSSGLTVGFNLTMPSGTPTDVLIINPTGTPSGKLIRAQVAGTDEFTVDPSGDGVFTGNVTAVNGTLSGTLGVTGTSTLGATNTGAFTATTGSFSSTLGVTGAVTLSSTLSVTGAITASNLTASDCVGTNGSKVLVSNSSCVESLTAGSNIVSSGISGSLPTVAVTAAPTFSGPLQAAGITNTGNHTLSQAISTDTGTSSFLAFTASDTGSTTFPTYTSTTDASGTSFPGSGYPQSVVITPTAYSATNMVVGSIWQIDTGSSQENVVITATNGTSTFTATFQESHANTGVTLKPIGIPVTVTPTVMEPGFVVGAVLAVDTGASEELVNVTAVTGTTFKAVFSENHGSTKTVTPISIPDTITPTSMTGIAVGSLLTVDSNLSAEPVVVTSTVPGTSFTANFTKTHSGTHLNVVGAATTSCVSTAASCSYVTANVGTTGGLSLTAPALQGSDNIPQGILQIVTPTNGQNPTNIPYDAALLGGQNGDVGKTSHTLFVNCNTQPQDCLMILLGGDTSGSTNQKCITVNTASAIPQPNTPSLMILKCRGDLAILGGNFQANSTANGQGGILTDNAAGVAGALGTGQVDIGGKGIIAADSPCAVTMPNAGTTTALTGGFACTITTGSSNSASAFVFTFANAFNTTPTIVVTCGTACVTSSSYLFPVLSSISTGGFTVTWVTSAGTATVLGSTKTFYIQLLGGK